MASILLLDDDDMLRCALAESLEDMGHTVIQSEDGLAAFSAERLAAVDLMITDLFMPRIDGMEAILNARRDAPNLPIIAMSGGSERLTQDFLPHSKEFGASEILRKPFALKVFRETVERVLSAPAWSGNLRPNRRAQAS